MIPSYNRIEISVKGDTCVLMGVKGLINRAIPYFPLCSLGIEAKILLFLYKNYTHTVNNSYLETNLVIVLCSYIYNYICK